MKSIKKLSLLLLITVLSVMCIAFSASATDSESGIIEGTKENITYKIYQDLSLMILSGEGKIPDHMFSSSSWCRICDPNAEYDGDGDGPEDVATDLDIAVAKVKTIIIEEGITEIGHYAFNFKEWPRELQTVVLPEGLKKIDAYAFKSLSNLTNINFPSSLEEIETCAFSATNLKNVTVPDTVKKLGKDVFEDCNNLKSITFTNAVCYISSCDSLETVTYPLDYEEVPQIQFCKNLKKVITPTTTSVNPIKPLNLGGIPAQKPFYVCRNLELVTLSDKAFEKFESENIDYEFISKKLPSKLDKATNLKCTDKGDFTVSWSKVKNAGYYQLYHYEKNKWVKIYEGVKTSFTLSEYVEVRDSVTGEMIPVIRDGFYGENKFRVRACAYDGNEYVRSSFVTVKTCRVASPNVEDIVAGKNKVTLTLSMYLGENYVSGYRVYYRVKGASSYQKFNVSTAKNTEKATTKATISKLTSGKTYQIKVRAYYKLDGKTYYGDYSSIKNVKVK